MESKPANQPSKTAKSNIISNQTSMQEKQEKLKRIEDEHETNAPKRKSPWIHAWTDNVAGLHSLSQLMCLCDLKNDGDYKLVVADLLHNLGNKGKQISNKGKSSDSRKMKIYMGTNVIYEAAIQEKPVAVETLYMDSKTSMPTIAVAGGSSIFYFRDFSPFMKFELPLIEFSDEESAIWGDLIKTTTLQFAANNEDATESSQEMDALSLEQLLEKLFQIRESSDHPKGLSYMSARLLALENQQEKYQFINGQMAFLKTANIMNGQRFCHKNFITCMKTIYNKIDEEKQEGLIIVGTENKELLVLEKTGLSVLNTIKLKAVPVFMVSVGAYQVDYKIFVACRNGCTYQIKNGNISNSFQVHIESKPTGLLKLDKTVVISGMNQNLYSFYNKGRINFCKQMPAEITDITKLEVRKTQNIQCVLVSLKNGEIRMYNDKYHIDTIAVGETVYGLRFGTFGREEGCLLINTASGGLQTKIIQRQANLQASSQRPGPPIEQDIPLNVPKKTKLFLELVQREKAQCVNMHRQFQKDLSKMRLKTAETYVDMLSVGYAPMSYSQGGAKLRLIANYEGIGPLFKIKLELQNLGKTCMVDTHVVLCFNEIIYKMRTRNPKVPMMIPSLQYKIDVEIECIDPTGANDVVKILIFNKDSTLPLITANIQMPMCEQEFDM